MLLNYLLFVYYYVMKKIDVGSLKVDDNLLDFINKEAIPGTGVDAKKFWQSFDKTVHELVPLNRNLIKKRDEIQTELNKWHLSRKGTDINKKDYFIDNFLRVGDLVIFSSSLKHSVFKDKNQ